MAQTVERWENDRIEWMRQNGVRRWRDAAGREIELSDAPKPPAPAPVAGPTIAKAALNVPAKGPRGGQ